MAYQYKTQKTCSRSITFDIVDGRVHNVRFEGGCHGNTQGVARLAEGRPVKEVISLLDGVDCKGRGTSCPDQLAKALRAALQQSAGQAE